MLRLILIVVLEVDARPNQVKWVRDDATSCICGEGGQRCDKGKVKGAVRHICTLIFKAKHYHEVLLEEVVDRVEDAREGHVAYERDLESSEESPRAFLHYDLAESVRDTTVLGEADDLQTSLHHDERVRYYRLNCA